MSELQDKLNRGEMTPQEFFDAWDTEIEENERLNPGFHDRVYVYLMGKYPGPGVDADEFFGLNESKDLSALRLAQVRRAQVRPAQFGTAQVRHA
jgi:hypothetical protein